jgi:hypothetical protein
MTSLALQTHAAPLMFCSPCSPWPFSDGTEEDSIDDVAPWPPGTRLRVKVLPDEKVPGWVLHLIKLAAEDWLTDLSKSLSLVWVSAEQTADVRISFRNDMPSWSCVGLRSAAGEQSEPTMNFAFDGWKKAKAVYSHAYVKRLATHLFGHALGL